MHLSQGFCWLEGNQTSMDAFPIAHVQLLHTTEFEGGLPCQLQVRSMTHCTQLAVDPSLSPSPLQQSLHLVVEIKNELYDTDSDAYLEGGAVIADLWLNEAKHRATAVSTTCPTFLLEITGPHVRRVSPYAPRQSCLPTSLKFFWCHAQLPHSLWPCKMEIHAA